MEEQRPLLNKMAKSKQGQGHGSTPTTGQVSSHPLSRPPGKNLSEEANILSWQFFFLKILH